MKYNYPLIAVLLSCIAVSLATPVASQVQTDEAVNLRYRRTLTETQIEQVSNDLAKDVITFDAQDRALVWSRLGDLWWKTDRERGRGFLVKAVQEIETATKNAADASPNTDLFKAIGIVSRITAARDQKLTDRLLASLSTLIKEDKASSSNEPSYLADSLVEGALQIASEDPARAAQLGSASLRYGNAAKFNLLLIGLRDRNGQLADNLFNEALVAAQASENFNLFSSLTFAAFTPTYNPGIKATPPPAQLRANLLGAIVRGVLLADSTKDQPNCNYAFLIAPLLSEVDQLTPQQSAPVRTALGRCTSSVPGGDATIQNQPKTVEDFLSAARNAEGTELRVMFLSRAVQVAASTGDLDRAISILDGMSREEREILGEVWDSIRVQYATMAGTRNYENKDFAAIDRVITAVPHELQPFVALNVAEAILEGSSEKNTVVTDLLAKARRSFEKLDNNDFNTFYPYMSLVRAYGKASPQDAYAVFREAVKYINRVTRAPKDKPDNSEQIARGQFEPLQIPEELVKLSAFDLISIVSSVESVPLRTRLRLSLLSSLLTYKQSLLKTPERPASKSKPGASS